MRVNREGYYNSSFLTAILLDGDLLGTENGAVFEDEALGALLAVLLSLLTAARPRGRLSLLLNLRFCI